AADPIGWKERCITRVIENLQIQFPKPELTAINTQLEAFKKYDEAVEETLTAREFALLSELVGHLGETLTRTELLSTVWGTGFVGAPNVVDVYVGYLRNKLRSVGGEAVTIQSVRGIGYRLTLTKSGLGAP
ncbi:MAG TPA: helix-turn-helix domain-containing protein, partial [Polyangium sp.]|nr:helix-turn-helix domain-containing protein [Polyangium sp.]